jgi:GT2 family glycosyltransferase
VTRSLGSVGVVAIGRNEGERLRRCLESVIGRAAAVVYVDSGSTDGSADLARSLGAEVVELDTGRPFTAARARNAGRRRLAKIAPGLEFLQFVDGDCEVVGGWLERAAAELSARPDASAVCGRRRERFRGATVYNRLIDMEWDTPVGEAEACGGDAMFRAGDFDAVGGYDDTLIAGEEPELCARLRARGGKVLRLDAEMTVHDAAMGRLSQWWRRSVRAGHAFAEVSRKHSRSPVRLWGREVRRIWFWAAGVPAAALLTAPFTGGLGLSLLGLLPVAAARAGWSRFRRGDPAPDAALFGLACTAAKFAELAGMLRYHANRLAGRAGGLIEYKSRTSSNNKVYCR